KAGAETQDEGVFRLIHQALLSLARQKGDRCGTIQELYWLGMGYFWLHSKLTCMPAESVEQYNSKMRFCFTESGAYLKYYDEIDDVETKGYILRARANVSLGSFNSPSERIAIVRNSLRIMQDKSYHEKAPELPWGRYIYMCHQQMTTSISYSKKKVMTPEDMADIMESAYIVYQQRLQETPEGKIVHMAARWAFPYYAIEYYCGLYDLDRLLTKVEKLMDAADPSDHSPDAVYRIMSLPAFYFQYLCQNPERIPNRVSYIESLYRRAMEYVGTFSSSEQDKIALYLRQLSFTYIETERGIPYGRFLEMLMLRFTPDVYIHSLMVGAAARTLCGIILDEEPDFFDDIEEIREIEDPAEKRRRLLEDAYQGGVLHDAGKISFQELCARPVRQWFEEEYEVTRLHTLSGGLMLQERPSTRRFAPIALGHHAWYDGTDHGYPDRYKRLECASRQLVDVISLVNWLEDRTHSAQVYSGVDMTFDEAVAEVIKLEGRRFSPMLTVRMQDRTIAEQIREAFEEGRQEAYRHMYEQK
ncbi:MAG: hypothetical protein K2O18_01405, partial [Oscillospiraceae bacterium]|nr:hypothetical protein [Oscillospiraceae bacterium]